MPTHDDDSSAKTPSQKLAELVAARKAAAGQGPANGVPGKRRSERGAAALSASKSKPALSK